MSRSLTLTIYTATALLLAGCAGWQPHAAHSPPGQDRATRAADAIREFEEHRDGAQYQAALDRCRQGDLGRAEALLAALVTRRPEFVQARLRLAEILASRGDPAAESHFLAILFAQPHHAEAHHAFGLYLDATGRPDLAQHHFSKAAEHDPENEIFRTTLTSKG